MKLRKSDGLWKMVMEEVFDDLLRFIFPDADQVYDMERGFEFLEQEMAQLYPEPDDEKDPRFVDKLVKVYRQGGGEEWVLLHIEIQGDTSKRLEFAERMYEYFVRIRARHGKPISAVAIFTGQYGKNMPGQYTYVYRSTRLTYEYRTLSILDFSDEELENSNNPFAVVVLAAKTSLLEGKIPEVELLDRKVLIASKLMKRGISAKKIRAILMFLENYVLFEDSKMNSTFKERIKLQDKNNVMSIDEYVRLSERESFVENLLKRGNFTEEEIASLANVTVDFVKKVKNALVTR